MQLARAQVCVYTNTFIRLKAWSGSMRNFPDLGANARKCSITAKSLSDRKCAKSTCFVAGQVFFLREKGDFDPPRGRACGAATNQHTSQQIANRQPKMDSLCQWCLVASNTPREETAHTRGIPDCGTKEEQWCCAARRNRTAGNSRRTAAKVRPVRPAVSERERRR